MGGISGWQLLILLLIVVLVFGTKRLRNIGSDLGGAVKGFRKGMDEGEEAASEEPEKLQADPDDTFLILSTSEQHYLQAICTDEGYYLEWRGGSDATHVGTDRMDLSLEEAKSAFRQYWEQHQG